MVNLPEGLRELVAVMEAGRDGSRNGSPVDRVHLKPNSDYEYTANVRSWGEPDTSGSQE